jgi:hypothetical protein
MGNKRRTALVLAMALMASLAISAVPAAATGDSPNNYTYQVTVENLTENQKLTPVVAATHKSSFRLFRTGHEASNGIQQLAENGGVPVLAAELSESSKVETVAVIGAAPLAPGESAVSIISTDRHHRRLSLAAMLICTNDGFAGRSSVQLPGAIGHERTFFARAYDAGTEVNTQAYVDLVPPCDGAGGATASNPLLAEDGVVRRHAGIVDGVGDLTVANHGWDEPVMKITVERVKTYQITVENLTGGQPLTPTVLATHARWQGIFDEGRAASNGVQQLAENGGVPTLAADLQAAPGVGTVAVIGSAPIMPGTSATLDIVASDRYRRASLAGMLVCTNDGFGGVDSLRLPRWVGEDTVSYGAAYDAGTEINTESYMDLVPPCDDSGGAIASNPALAEGGVVHEHGGIVGGSDLMPDVHGWDGAVIKVTIERTG